MVPPPIKNPIRHPTTESIVTTIKNIVTSAINETMTPGSNNESSTIDLNNATETNNSIMPTKDENEIGGMEDFAGMFNTSFEKVTTTLSSIETENMMNTSMGQYEKHDDNYYILFIVLGIVLGILIITGAILGVIYNHYKKTGFHELPGVNKQKCETDPQSMVQIEQQIQQACSEDALLDKK